MSRAKILAVSILALVLMCPVSGTLAQQSRAAQVLVAAASMPAASGEQEGQTDANSLSNVVKKEEDPTEAFRHSSAVKLVSRLTGLSEEKAFWLCMVLNFIVVFVVLWVLLRKTIPAIFRSRTEAIQRRLEEARKTSEEARRRLTEVEARLSRLDIEIGQMRQEAEDAGRHEEERVMAGAEEERRRIVESAEQEIARAANAARRDLKAYAAELSVSLAEKKIRIEAGIDQKLVRDFTAQLGRNGDH